MAIKIIHTADNHIGLKFRTITDAKVKERLISERFDALERIVQKGNESKCDFLVVAGDLFDTASPLKGDIDKTINILRKFENEVIVVPGNHDYYEGVDSKVWSSFLDNITGSRISLLIHYRAEKYETNEGDVYFYPCPCNSKHGDQHLTGWVGDVPKDPKAIHIGIAHGNVEGLGLDEEGRYFNMTENDLKSAGVDTWLLGHIHVPYPSSTNIGNPVYFMSGTHTPEHIKRRVAGGAWLIEIDKNKDLKFEQFISGSISFHRIEATIKSENDIEQLKSKLDQLTAASTILDLKLTGRLSISENESLQQMVEELEKRFLYLTSEKQILKKIDITLIGNEFADGTFANELLKTLSNDSENERALELAYDRIKQNQQ